MNPDNPMFRTPGVQKIIDSLVCENKELKETTISKRKLNSLIKKSEGDIDFLNFLLTDYWEKITE